MKYLILSLLRYASGIWLSFRGCQLGHGVIVNGMPYIRRKRSGRIILSDRVNIVRLDERNSKRLGAARGLLAHR